MNSKDLKWWWTNYKEKEMSCWLIWKDSQTHLFNARMAFKQSMRISITRINGKRNLWLPKYFLMIWANFKEKNRLMLSKKYKTTAILINNAMPNWRHLVLSFTNWAIITRKRRCTSGIRMQWSHLTHAFKITTSLPKYLLRRSFQNHSMAGRSSTRQGWKCIKAKQIQFLWFGKSSL